ncbi:unnamed protein product [Scytosiphon promiscuus]
MATHRQFLCRSNYQHCSRCAAKISPGETMRGKPPTDGPPLGWTDACCFPSCSQAVKDRATRTTPYPEVDLSPRDYSFRNRYANVYCCCCFGEIAKGARMTSTKHDVPEGHRAWFNKRHETCSLPVHLSNGTRTAPCRPASHTNIKREREARHATKAVKAEQGARRAARFVEKEEEAGDAAVVVKEEDRKSSAARVVKKEPGKDGRGGENLQEKKKRRERSNSDVDAAIKEEIDAVKPPSTPLKRPRIDGRYPSDHGSHDLDSTKGSSDSEGKESDLSLARRGGVLEGNGGDISRNLAEREGWVDRPPSAHPSPDSPKPCLLPAKVDRGLVEQP